MSEAASTPRLPANSRVRVVEESSDRLVLHVSGGGPRTRVLGWFAVVWNLFLFCFTPAAMLVGQINGAGPVWGRALFLSGFWVIGLGVACWWVRMRFTRLNLLVEPHRVALQKILFNRTKLEETELDADSKVELVESYHQNNAPVYVVAVSGADREIKFGTPLSDADKRYLVRKIRQFTRVQETEADAARRPVREFPGNCESCGSPLPKPGRDDIAVVCEHCGRSHTGTVVVTTDNVDSPVFADLDPSQLPQGSIVFADDSDPERLVLRYPAIDPQWASYALAAAVTVGVLAAGSVITIFNLIVVARGNGNLPLQIVGSLVLLVVAVVVCVRSIRRAEISLEIGPELLQRTYRWGPLPFTRYVRPQDVWQVVLTRNPHDEALIRRNRAVHWSKLLGKAPLACVVRTDEWTVPLTFGHSATTTREVAGLVRKRLRQMGYDV